MANRDTVVICWELLRAMAPGPQLRTRLARVSNVPYDRLPRYLEFLTSNGLAKVAPAEGHEWCSITPTGMEALDHLDRGLKILFPALG